MGCLQTNTNNTASRQTTQCPEYYTRLSLHYSGLVSTFLKCSCAELTVIQDVLTKHIQCKNENDIKHN